MAATNPPTPYQWSVGDIGSASLMNAQLHDGLTYLLNPVLAVLYASAAQTLTNTTSTLINIDTAITDPFAGLSSAGHSWTAPFSAWYDLHAKIHYTGNATGARAAWFNVNGSSVTGAETWANPSNAGTCTALAEATAYVTAGQTVTLLGYQSSGGNLATTTTSGVYAYMRVKFAHM